MIMALTDRQPASVLVVGASAGGLSTAESLRRQGFRGSITMIGDEDHLPYDRPPLSKQVLRGDWTEARARLRQAEQLAGLEAELITGDAAADLDVGRRRVTTASGKVHTAEVVVIATGLRARRFAKHAEPTGVRYLRTIEDARQLRSGLASGHRLLVVGDGVLGCEIAATARQLGTFVTVVGPQSAVMHGYRQQVQLTDEPQRCRVCGCCAGDVSADRRIASSR